MSPKSLRLIETTALVLLWGVVIGLTTALLYVELGYDPVPDGWNF